MKPHMPETLARQGVSALLALTAAASALAQATAEQNKTVAIASVHAATGYFEYTKDGTSPLGIVTKSLGGDRVSFTMCDSTTVEVNQADLRPSRAKCDSRKPGGGLWGSIARLEPVYRPIGDTSGTTVLVGKQAVDIKKIPGWEETIVTQRVNGKDPVGYMFKDPQGKTALAILKDKAVAN